MSELARSQATKPKEKHQSYFHLGAINTQHHLEQLQKMKYLGINLTKCL